MKKMNVLKKICSCILAVAMLLSVIPTSVFASEKESPVIDASKTGSLTINKYDQNYNEESPVGIEGITFIAYQILNIEKVNNEIVYSINDNVLPFFMAEKLTVEQILSMDGTELEKLSERLSIFLEENSKVVKLIHETTDANGQAKFEDLPLGYYFIVEAKSEKVESVINPFFVSIPMTVSKTEGEKTKTYWEYDVVANPKNITNLNNLTVIKTGKIGNSTATLLEGVKFDLEKNIDGNWTFISEYVTDTNGSFEVTDYLDRGTYRLKETFAPEGYILDTYEFIVQYNDDTNELEYVYNDTVYSKEVGLKIEALNEKPTIDKTVAGGSSSTSASIGEEVRWTITATVPSTVDQLTTYKITDTLSDGLTYNSSKADITVTLDGNDFTDYELEVNGQTLTFTFDHEKLVEGKQLVISYDTTINENAVIGETGNPNEVVLDYSNSTDVESGTTPTNPETDPKVYTFGLNLTKENKEGTKLSGAVFTLYKEDGKTVVASGLTTDDNGLIQVKGLAAGKYVLVETQAPEGYNLLKEPVEFEITAKYGVNKEGEVYITETNTKDGYYEMTVLNNKGFTLPETGGMGTVIFTVAGLAIMGLAGASYIALKRKESQQ